MMPAGPKIGATRRVPQRVTASPRPPAGSRRATAFADAMARARARLDLRLAAPSMTLFHLPTCLHASRPQAHTHHSWAPQLRLSLAFAGPLPLRGRAEPASSLRLERLRLMPPTLERLHARAARQETVRDDATRSRTGPASRERAAQDQARAARVAAVPRILARRAPAPSPGEGASGTAGPAAMPWPSPGPSLSSRLPQVTGHDPAPERRTLAPAELDRITDHVLHAVGRRMTAYNERRGR